MTLLTRKLAVLAKTESTYGTDPTPTGAANAILVRNLNVTPISVTREARDLYRPYFGNSSDVIGAYFAKIAFDVEAASGPAAGTPPAYAPLLRACALAEVITAGVQVQYTPVSTNLESLTMYAHLDGVLHKIVGAKGSVKFSAQYRQAPMWNFEFTGLFVPVTDAALPTAVYTGFKDPVAMNKVNTPVFTLHGVSGIILRSISLDIANDVVYRNMVNSELVRIVDRKPGGALEIGSELMSVKNWFNSVRDASTGVLTLQHGIATGNIIGFYAPALQLNDISYGDFEGDRMLQATHKLMPASGNDELTITFN